MSNNLIYITDPSFYSLINFGATLTLRTSSDLRSTTPLTMNFYKSAALALDHLDKHQGSVKGSLTAAGVAGSHNDAKRILALVIETLKCGLSKVGKGLKTDRDTLQTLLTTVPILTLEKLTFPRKTPPKTPTSASLVLVLLHDLLFTSRGIQASDNWPPKAAIKKHQARLKGELVRLQLKAGAGRKEDLAKASSSGAAARYIRWNPNVDLHRSEDWSLPSLESHLTRLGYTRQLAPAYPVPAKSWFYDPHIPHLLVFPENDDWWKDDQWYLSGAIILQDKASCMPALVLMDGWTFGGVLDATAAPGNKTSYISALMSDQGRVVAFEKSHGRHQTLEKMLGIANCQNVKTRRADFTESDPTDPEWKDIRRILLDPSCSGSGIVNRLDYLLENAEGEPEAQAGRLEKLASFQLQMILHAFKFPTAERIVYSTCSIHAEEDEQVVLRALSSTEAKSAGWTLAPRKDVLPKWERRGRAEEVGGDQELANGVIRCLPEDHTNGFFVACFIRTPAGAASAKKVDRKRKHPVDETLLVPDGQTSDEALVTSAEARIKTQAQLDRAKRKKATQKKKRKLHVDE